MSDYDRRMAMEWKEIAEDMQREADIDRAYANDYRRKLDALVAAVVETREAGRVYAKSPAFIPMQKRLDAALATLDAALAAAQEPAVTPPPKVPA